MVDHHGEEPSRGRGHRSRSTHGSENTSCRTNTTGIDRQFTSTQQRKSTKNRDYDSSMTSAQRRHREDPCQKETVSNTTTVRRRASGIMILGQQEKTIFSSTPPKKKSPSKLIRGRAAETKNVLHYSNRSRTRSKSRKKTRSRSRTHAGRSASRTKSAKPLEDGSTVRKKSVNARTASDEKKPVVAPGLRRSSTIATKKNKKMDPSRRRTRSCEGRGVSITGATKFRSTGNNVSCKDGLMEVKRDARGLPLTSVGCPAVASLARTASPNNVEDTDSFHRRDGDAKFARQLQNREYPSANERTDRRRSSSLETPQRRCTIHDSDLKMPAVDGDRNLAGTKQTTKSTVRRTKHSRASEHLQLAPLNPCEVKSRGGQHCFKRSESLGEARNFTKRLRSIAADCTYATVGPVFNDDELMYLVQSMFEMQSSFHQQGKPTVVNVGYHFCRCSNLQRIQEQPGLWSKIQSRGVNQSQDGEGVYTFNRPPLGDNSSVVPSFVNKLDDGDVYMIVARLEGNQALLMRSPSASRRQWTESIDSLRGGDIVVLKTSAQFFPLLKFSSGMLFEHAGRLKSNLRVLQLLQERLQFMLNDFFNSTGANDEVSHASSPPIRRWLSIPIYIEDDQLERQKMFEKRRGTQECRECDLARGVEELLNERIGLASAINSSLILQQAVSSEELTALVQDMLETQSRGIKEAFVDIGYHYCRSQNLQKMQQKGFWSSIQSRGHNKSEDGDGIYTFNNPLRSGNSHRGGFFDVRQSVSSYDDAWLLVARIQGARMQSTSIGSGIGIGGISREWTPDVDSIVLSGHHQSDEVVVLKKSTQFFPILQFRAADLHSVSVDSYDTIVQEIQMVHQRVQRLLDDIFNPNISGDDEIGTLRDETLHYIAPETLDGRLSVRGTSHQVYTILSSNKRAVNDDCAICLESLRRTNRHQVARLDACGHFFHRTCLHEALDRFDSCPICNQVITPAAPKSCLWGLSPSGKMEVTTASSVFCSGTWAPEGSLLVKYSFPDGTQKVYHDNPGHSFSGASWETYLPHNKQGVMLLRRLQYGFLHGLLFSVEGTIHGTDGVAWACVSHKTHPSTPSTEVSSITAQTAFPDRAHFEICHIELDKHGVPPFEACKDFVSENLLNRNLSPEWTSISGYSMMTRKVSRCCLKILKNLQQHSHGWIFCKALPVLDGTISESIDLETIEGNLHLNKYKTIDAFGQDVNLVFENAMASHSRESPVFFMASQLKRQFKKDFKDMQLSVKVTVSK